MLHPTKLPTSCKLSSDFHTIISNDMIIFVACKTHGFQRPVSLVAMNSIALSISVLDRFPASSTSVGVCSSTYSIIEVKIVPYSELDISYSAVDDIHFLVGISTRVYRATASDEHRFRG